MGPVEPGRSADECYQGLQLIARRLEELYAAGRLSMSPDPSNTEWRDLDDAVRAVGAALDVAIQATAWMDTAQ